jgi:transcriptional regulatory protein RtcR
VQSLRDQWDFEEVYTLLQAYVRSYEFMPDEEEYLVYITTGLHERQICLFVLTESLRSPRRLLQTSPEDNKLRNDRFSLQP